MSERKRMGKVLLKGEAYTLAQAFDERVNEMIKEFPLEHSENLLGWLAFIRTCQTTLELAEIVVKAENGLRQDIAGGIS